MELGSTLGRHPIDQAALAAERLRKQPGWESRADLMLGTIRVAVRDVPGAAESFRRALGLDPKEIDNTRDPAQLRKQIARTFLRVGQPAEARTPLQSILAQKEDPEAAWLLSRTYLQEGDKARAQAAMVRAGSFRADNPLEEEPSPYVGESRCKKCRCGDLPGLAGQPAYSRTSTHLRGSASSRRCPARIGRFPIPPTPRSLTRSRKSKARSGRRLAPATPSSVH